jgi:hypothetical protein
VPQEDRTAPLWERRKARCSCYIEARSIAASAAPTKAARSTPVGAPEGAMLFAHRSQEHRGCRRSHKGAHRRCHKRIAPHPCGSAARRDALRTSKPGASRLPPLPQKPRAAPLWERRKARCPCYIEAGSIAGDSCHPWHSAFGPASRFAPAPRGRSPPLPQKQRAAPLWERRKARCSCYIEAGSPSHEKAHRRSHNGEVRRACTSCRIGLPDQCIAQVTLTPIERSGANVESSSAVA